MDEKQAINYKCTLSEETQKIAKNELREDENIRVQLMEQFVLWIKKHPLIKNCRTDPIFLLRFLRATKFSLPIAQQMLEKYLTVKELNPNWFQHLSMYETEVEALANNGYLVPLLEPDINGRTVVLFNVARFDPYKFTTAHMVRTHSIIFEALMENEENQIRGFTYILDESGLSMSHLSCWSLVDIRKLIYCVQNTMPMRHKHTYIVNIPTYGVKFIEICLSYVNKKLRERCTVHKSIKEIKDVIDLKSLPKECGGEVPIQKMIDSLKDILVRKKEHINTLNNMHIDTTSANSHLSCNEELNGISGSFRKLEVD